MNKLERYALESTLMNIRIKYGEELVKFNLHEELVINEERINSEIQIQPSVYGFLGILHKKLVRIARDMEAEMNKEHARLFILYKGEPDSNTGRVIANDMVESKILVNLKYQAKVKQYNEAEEYANIIEVCMDSFEQRANMIQTLSANIRKDRS